jgi:succinyl-diaminopimelate desuccinylase
MEMETLLSRIQEEELVEVCRQLVRINSVNPPGSEREITIFVAEYLQKAGLEVEVVPHTPQRSSVLARLRGNGELPGLLFSAHLDTVPVGVEKWVHDPFAGELSDGKIWGRGAADMKSGLAAILLAAKALAQDQLELRGDVILALTADEEVNGMGAIALSERHDLQPLQAIIVAEPSGNEIFIAEKGILWLEIVTRGKTAHGSMPELGRNAVMMMVKLLVEMERMPVPFEPHPLLGGFSLSVNSVSGGVKANVVPDYCIATVDMRTVPGQDHTDIFRRVEALINDLARREPGFLAEVKVINDWPAVVTAPDEPVVQRFNDALAAVSGTPSKLKGVRYYTDAAALVPALNAPMLICGPGEAGMAHQPEEFVAVDKLIEAARIYTWAAFQLLN